MAGAGNSYSFNIRNFNHFWWCKCCCPIYIHPVLTMQKVKSNPTNTMLVITTGFLVIFIITKLHWALIVALCVGLVGVFSTFLSKQTDYLWNKLAWVLSLIVPNILLALIFYLFLFPIALLSKLFGKNDAIKLKNNSDSVFITSNKEFDKSTFEKSW
jgi:hypothetical protein